MALSVSELLQNSNNHRAWADEFCRIAREINFDPADPEHVDWVAGWIANAMMNGVDRAWKMAPILPTIEGP